MYASISNNITSITANVHMVFRVHPFRNRPICVAGYICVLGSGFIFCSQCFIRAASVCSLDTTDGPGRRVVSVVDADGPGRRVCSDVDADGPPRKGRPAIVAEIVYKKPTVVVFPAGSRVQTLGFDVASKSGSEKTGIRNDGSSLAVADLTCLIMESL